MRSDITLILIQEFLDGWTASKVEDYRWRYLLHDDLIWKLTDVWERPEAHARARFSTQEELRDAILKWSEESGEGFEISEVLYLSYESGRPRQHD